MLIFIKKDQPRDDQAWRDSKKIGSFLGDSEDMARRKQLATVAVISLNEMWSRRKIVGDGETKRLRTYNKCVKPVLTYNMCTWGLQDAELELLNTCN